MEKQLFSEYLRAEADPIWQAQHNHPFVRGIGDSTLDPDRFAHWLAQDYLFLIDYSRTFAAAILRAPDLEAMQMFATLLHETLTREMSLHRSYCEEFGVTAEELERGTKEPVTQGYTDFLVRTGTTGDYAEVLGALLPCFWGYSEIGTELAARGTPEDERYQRWIALYADPEFAELAAWCRNLVDRACLGLPEESLDRVRRAFITSSRYELHFWDMAWARDTWLA